MWTPTTRQQHNRPVTRYQTDLTDAEWRVIAPHLPKPCATGRPRAWPTREILNGIFYVMRAGCPWRLLPNDLPPWETIYRWFSLSMFSIMSLLLYFNLYAQSREGLGLTALEAGAALLPLSVSLLALALFGLPALWRGPDWASPLPAGWPSS